MDRAWLIHVGRSLWPCMLRSDYAWLIRIRGSLPTWLFSLGWVCLVNQFFFLGGGGHFLFIYLCRLRPNCVPLALVFNVHMNDGF